MRWVEPKVFKVAETRINREELAEFLRELGAETWMEKQPWYGPRSTKDFDHATALIEVAGRACYKSFAVGRNPTITRIGENSGEKISTVLSKGEGWIFDLARTS